MKEHFLNHDQSLAVKELGFDEPCLAVYHRDGSLMSIVPEFTKEQQSDKFGLINNSECLWEDDEESINGIQEVSAPLKNQFFKWVRENKMSDSCVCRYQSRDDGGIYYYYVINHDYGVEETKHYKEGFYSYEQAEDACIDKIIELIKYGE